MTTLKNPVFQDVISALQEAEALGAISVGDPATPVALIGALIDPLAKWLAIMSQDENTAYAGLDAAVIDIRQHGKDQIRQYIEAQSQAKKGALQ